MTSQRSQKNNNMPVRNYIRRHAYRWHRITGVIAALPILLWTVSGCLHPVMNSFRPNVQNQYLPPAAIDTSKVRLSLPEALVGHGLDRLQKFPLV